MKILRRELDSHIYLAAGQIIEYVYDEIDVAYTNSGMRDLLHRERCTYKKPKLVSGEPDKQVQENFVHYYERFMENKEDDVEVLFLDAVHPEHNTMAAYGWMKRGEVRKLNTNSGRQRLNLHGDIHAEAVEMTLIESETINNDSTVQLIEMLGQKYACSKEVIIILDNAKYQYSKDRRLLKRAPGLSWFICRLIFLNCT